MRVQESFTIIFCDENNLTYTIISCNLYKDALVQRHTGWFHHSVAKIQHLYLLLLMTRLCKCVKEWQGLVVWLRMWAFATIRSFAGIQISKLILFSISSIPFPVQKLVTLMSLIQSFMYYVMIEIKNDQSAIFFSIWLCYIVHRLVASTVCGFIVTHSTAYHLMITLLLKLSLNYTQNILTLAHKNVLIFMCSFIQWVF